MDTCKNTPTPLEFNISGLEAMLAGTLCLLSAYCHRQGRSDTNYELIGLKIISNLTCLQCQNSLSSEFRRVLAKVCESWQQHGRLLQSTPQTTPRAEGVYWHPAPPGLH